jgi:hypothetical protein
LVFDVKYDLRNKARLVAGGNWTVNDKEDIYSGVVCMDTVRIGCFLGELYGLSCWACDIGNACLYGKAKYKVYITAVPEFGESLHGENPIIDESLYGLKTSAARFHEHVSESILRLEIQEEQLWPLFMDGGQVIKLWIFSYVYWWHSHLEQGSYGSHKVIGKDIYAKECGHFRMLFW